MPRGGSGAPRRSDRDRALVAFDQAVDRLGEDAAFLEAASDRLAARYVGSAHAILAEVRLTMHELEARSSDASLRQRARRRIHDLAVGVAESGLFDAARVTETARRLGGDPTGRSGWAPALRTQTSRATAWGMEKWSGSPLSASELRSTRAASDALAAQALITRRGVLPAAPVQRRRRLAALSAIGVGGAAVLGFAGYGVWTLIAQALGLG